jgi:hypothetical protein
MSQVCFYDHGPFSPAGRRDARDSPPFRRVTLLSLIDAREVHALVLLTHVDRLIGQSSRVLHLHPICSRELLENIFQIKGDGVQAACFSYRQVVPAPREEQLVELLAGFEALRAQPRKRKYIVT